MGFHMPQHTRMAISPQRVIRSTSCLVLGYGFQGRRIEWRFPVTSNPAAILDNFEWPYLYNSSFDGAHRTVIFVAQLFCLIWFNC